MRNDFAIFILSHGRANNVVTVDTLLKSGYTGKYYILIDNEDKQAQTYYDNFGKDKVIMFNKEEVAKTFDIMDNFEGRQVPTFARNMLYTLAEELHLTYFLELEDDYSCFRRRYESNSSLAASYVTDFDAIVDVYLEYLEKSGAVTVAFAQTGDLIGGLNSHLWKVQCARKAMNCFFCKTDRRFQYLGRFNDDVNAYVEFGKKGLVFLTPQYIVMDQPTTQVNDGGITDAYKLYGTYVKSFYSVMLCPSSVKIHTMGNGHYRIHHKIDWEHTVPKIISSDFKK